MAHTETTEEYLSSDKATVVPANAFPFAVLPEEPELEVIKKYLPHNAVTTVHGRTVLFPVSPEELKEVCVTLSATHGLPLKTMFASDMRGSDGSFRISYVFGVPKENYFLVPYLRLVDTLEFPSLAGVLYATALYEPHIKEMFGLMPVGFPGDKVQPSILHGGWPKDTFPMRKDFVQKTQAHREHTEGLQYAFHEVGGDGMYEVPVGPVHAGIIEPGHFRFSMAGEVIVKLEPKLGWVHKGSEKLFETLSLADKLKLSERIAGDTSFAHGTAFAQAIEELAGVTPSARTNYLRVIFGELERLANHFNDIGFIMFDTGFNFGGAQCTRLRERVMQINYRLTGSRFLRGVTQFGGVAHDISDKDKEDVADEVTLLGEELASILEVARGSSILKNRLEGTGRLTIEVAKDHDAVGVPARASGLAVDARADFPYAAYSVLHVSPVVFTEGDVEARFEVRIAETFASIKLIKQALLQLPAGGVASETNTLTLKKNATIVGITEGWRGDIVYVVSTDEAGNINRVAVRDPSFINWNLIPHAAPGNVLLDFPLINKSFNLSYTGYDR